MASSSFMFKVRTVTVGLALAGCEDPVAAVVEAAQRCSAVAEALQNAGYEVQTQRVTTDSFEDWLDGAGNSDGKDEESEEVRRSHMVAGVGKVLAGLDTAGYDSVLLNIGPATTPASVARVPTVVASHGRVTCSAHVGCDEDVLVADMAMAKACAEAIVEISKTTPAGGGNFQFAATFNCPPGVPYFPAGYHGGPSTFAIGLENPDIVLDSFREASGDMKVASALLTKNLDRELGAIETICEAQSVALGIPVSKQFVLR